MSLVDLTIREAALDALRALVRREDGTEAGAYVLCGECRIQSDPWERRSRRRLTVHAVLPVPCQDAVSASETHVTWITASYVKLLKRAKDEGLVPGIVHTHPRGPAQFSGQDDRNEKDLLQLARNRNGDKAALVSILLAGDDQVRARLWPDSHDPIDAADVRIAGKRLECQSPALDAADADFLARQALAFGGSLNARLRVMRVGIVGCGGTGSATAMLLARLGVGRLVLFDDDIVEVTNLNRLHGARRADADAMRPKVDVVAREITELGIGTRVIPLRGWVGDPRCRDALKSCDVIFGCTDDHDGRLMLNRLAYFYLIRVIDMGLAIDPAPDGRCLRDLSGRVTVLLPGGTLSSLSRCCRSPRSSGRGPETAIARRIRAAETGGLHSRRRQPGPGGCHLHDGHGLPCGRRTASGVDRIPRFRWLGVATHAPFRSSPRPATGRQPATALCRLLVDGLLGSWRCRSISRSGWISKMWRDAVRWLFVRLRLVRRPDLVGRIIDRHPTPEELPEGKLVMVRDGNLNKWACLRCPGRCGEKLQLALSSSRHPRWCVRLDWLRRPSSPWQKYVF